MSSQPRRGDLDTIDGKNERNQSCRVVLKADGNAWGHVWLPNGDCAASEIRRGGPAFVGASRLRKDAWAEVRRKVRKYDTRRKR
jgi:hypothetical protein